MYKTKNKRLSELSEEAISKSSKNSYRYATEVLQGRFKLGEEVVRKSATYGYLYYRDVLKERFKLDEINADDWYTEITEIEFVEMGPQTTRIWPAV